MFYQTKRVGSKDSAVRAARAATATAACAH
jgi:hypothetical protein